MVETDDWQRRTQGQALTRPEARRYALRAAQETGKVTYVVRSKYWSPGACYWTFTRPDPYDWRRRVLESFRPDGTMVHENWLE